MKGKTIVTESDVQQALKKFIRQGGLIRHLPDEISPKRALVGGRWGMYETVMETTIGARA